MPKYVHGSAARPLPKQAPKKPTNVPKKKPKTRTSKKQSKAVQRRSQLNFIYTIAVASVVVILFYTCYQYLNLQASVQNHKSELTQLEADLTSLKDANDDLEMSIQMSIDYDSIYDTAINDLGMVYPGRDNVIYYESGESEYVQQYGSIPE